MIYILMAIITVPVIALLVYAIINDPAWKD